MSDTVKAGDLIAVYGTLRGNRMPSAEFVGNGTVKGKLLHLGGFPGLVQTNEDREVVVEVYRVPDPSLITSHLDFYEGYRVNDEEGSMYVRRKLPVNFVVPEGEGDEHHADLHNIREAWIYLWNREKTHSVIESGDWFKRG